LIDGEKRNIKKPPSRRRTRDELWWIDFTKRRAMADGDGDLEVPWGLLLGIYQMGIPAM
jgi:hypothetical protein